MDFREKNIVYVGGFGGIGLATCRQLMQKDISSLVILDINEKPETLNELKRINPSVVVFYIKVDLCDKENIKHAIKETVGRIKFIDILINGSGVVNEKNVELAVTVNLIGVINVTLTAIPYMDKSIGGRGGLIVNVSSILGLEPAPQIAVYCGTKHGVIGFTRSIAEDFYYQRTGIMMMLFCPGLTITPLTDVSLDQKLTFPYSTEAVRLATAKSQTADECATSLVEAVARARNGIVWMSEAGKLQEIEMHKYWEPNC